MKARQGIARLQINEEQLHALDSGLVNSRSYASYPAKAEDEENLITKTNYCSIGTLSH